MKAKAVLTHRNVKIAILSIWVTSLITTLPLPIKFTYVATAHFEEVWLEQTEFFKSVREGGGEVRFNVVRFRIQKCMLYMQIQINYV